MMRLRPTLAAGALLLAVGLSGCAGGGSGQAPSAEGTWGSSAEGQPQLVLAADGTLSGTDGCNRLAGSWEQSGADVTFGQVASTLMACEGVDTWLSTLDSATIDGSTLHVKDQSGAEIGTLSRG